LLRSAHIRLSAGSNPVAATKEKRMHLYVRNVHEIESREPPKEPHIIISIRTPGDKVPDVKQNDNTVAVHYYEFPDLDNPPAIATVMAFPQLKEARLFDEKMAVKMARQIQDAVDDGIDHLVVHCFAGQSRSAAVAAAVAKYYNGDDNEYFAGITTPYGRPRYTPNMRVYTKLLDALHYENS
jgi:predicted protein tyrosine phosphatase